MEVHSPRRDELRGHRKDGSTTNRLILRLGLSHAWAASSLCERICSERLLEFQPVRKWNKVAAEGPDFQAPGDGWEAEVPRRAAAPAEKMALEAIRGRGH